MTTRVAIYARHSSDKQVHSTQDQIARCQKYCRENGYEPVLVFQDESISGAFAYDRQGLANLIEAAVEGYFDCVLAEDLSRISRDQGDVAHVYRKLVYLDIELRTIAEGQITPLHIGFKGTMNAMYLTDLSDKTHRGMVASVLKGNIPGGLAYGYDVVHHLDDRGEVVRGNRKINEEQAEIVRWIFDQYEGGATLNHICNVLNRQGVPSPKGGEWIKTTLVGQIARKTGLLRQTLYKGVVTFNRMMYRKNPDTGKRQSFLRPEEEWIKVPVPELAIISEAQFDRVQKMIEERSSMHKKRLLLNKALKKEEKPPRKRKKAKVQRPKMRQVNLYVFSGKLWCAFHDQAISVVRKHKYSCAAKPCPNRNLKHEYLMDAAFEAMQQLTIDQINEANAELSEVRKNLEKEIAANEAELENARKEMRTLLDNLASRRMTKETKPFLDEREAAILKIRYKIERLKKDYAPMAELPEQEAIDILLRYDEAIFPLSKEPDHQPTISRIYPWFKRFTVDLDLQITIEYDWIRLLSDLRSSNHKTYGSGSIITAPEEAKSQVAS